MSDASGLERLEAGRAEPAGNLAHPMDPGTDRVQDWPQRRRRRGLFEQQPIRLPVQRPGGIEHQGVHCRFQVAPERLRKLPIAGHSAPQRIHGDKNARLVHGEDLAQVPRLQGTHRERLARPAVERSAGVEYRPMHHVQARSADHHAQPLLGPIEPVLQHAGDARVRGDQVWQLVHHERATPPDAVRLGGEPRQERVPVRVFHVGESGKPLGHRGGQVASLYGRGGLIGDGVEPPVAPRPLDEQARLAHPAAPPDDREQSRLPECAVQAAHLVDSVEEPHGQIMPERIMRTCIIRLR